MYLAEKLEENVYYYKNVIEDPAILISLIEDNDQNESIHPVIPEWGIWYSSSGDGKSFGGKKDFNPSGLVDIPEKEKEIAQYIMDVIQGAVKNVALSFIEDRGLDIEANISPFCGVEKYRKDCEMGAHFDRQAGDQSLLWSIVLYLNEDYEGGEISFVIREEDFRIPENGKFRPFSDINDPRNKDLISFWLKPEAGSALIFPSTEPYKHQVHLMKSGEKYIFPGFIFVEGYDPFAQSKAEAEAQEAERAKQ